MYLPFVLMTYIVISSDNDEKEEGGEEFGENIEGSDDDVEGKRAVTYQVGY